MRYVATEARRTCCLLISGVTLSSSDEVNDGDRRSLVSHDYDSVYSSRRSSRSSTIYSTLKNSSPPPETSTGYTTVNHSNQQPNYTSSSECESFSRGIKTTHTSYGAVDGDVPPPEVQYSYVPVERGRGRPISSATAPQSWTKQDDLIASVGENEESAYNSMVYTTRHEFVYQVRHYKSYSSTIIVYAHCSYSKLCIPQMIVIASLGECTFKSLTLAVS